MQNNLKKAVCVYTHTNIYIKLNHFVQYELIQHCTLTILQLKHLMR